MSSPGRIITFYSYKGGVGRSMALANMAWLLASNGKRVAAIDFDLEAPGLHRFFRPFLPEERLASTRGLIDYFVEQRATTLQRHTVPSLRDHSPRITEFTLPIPWDFESPGRLDLILAGTVGGAYARTVEGFNWQEFYEKFDGAAIVEQMKRDLRDQYDYVLVDSRTGITDSGGICTIQLPDDLVLCFAPSTQNIEGAAAVARMVSERRRDIHIFPVMTRVEFGEMELLDNVRVAARRIFTPHLWYLPEDAWERYWNETEIPYIPFYAYVEILCAFGRDVGSPRSMAAAIERLSAFLTSGDVTKTRVAVAARRADIASAFLNLRPAAPSCMISYADEDREFAHRLSRDLRASGITCWFAPDDLLFGAKIRDSIDEAIRSHDHVLVVVSANSLTSDWVAKEVETAFEIEQQRRAEILIPLRIDDAVLETKAAWAADIRRRRNIGDFSEWQDAARYKAAFERLVTTLHGR